jgi:RimJ/RimL family protein N-acetyltransferase
VTATVLATARLRLRRFTASDVGRLTALDNDPEVMAYIDRGPGPTSDQVRAGLDGIIAEYAAWPHYGMWAAERTDTGAFVGWLALRPHGGRPPDEPDIGWRLRREAWGHGYATEGARALLGYAFATCGARLVTAETMAVNVRSRAVMERLGMRHVRTYVGEFDDPIPGSELGEVVYAIGREEWAAVGRAGA